MTYTRGKKNPLLQVCSLEGGTASFWVDVHMGSQMP